MIHKGEGDLNPNRDVASSPARVPSPTATEAGRGAERPKKRSNCPPGFNWESDIKGTGVVSPPRVTAGREAGMGDDRPEKGGKLPSGSSAEADTKGC